MTEAFSAYRSITDQKCGRINLASQLVSHKCLITLDRSRCGRGQIGINTSARYKSSVLTLGVITIPFHKPYYHCKQPIRLQQPCRCVLPSLPLYLDIVLIASLVPNRSLKTSLSPSLLDATAAPASAVLSGSSLYGSLFADTNGIFDP